MSSSRVSFDATHVFVNMHDLAPFDQQKVILDLQFGATSGVPEPVSAGMVGLAAAGVGAPAQALIAGSLPAAPALAGQPDYDKPLIFLVGAAGLEPATLSLEG